MACLKIRLTSQTLWVLAMAVFLGFVGCLFNVESKVGVSPSLRYNVGVLPGPRPEIEVKMDLVNWPTTSPKTFILPPYYADNPTWPIAKKLLKKIQAWDCQGAPLPLASNQWQTVLTSNASGTEYGTLPATTCKWSYRLDLDTLAPARYGLAMPNIAAGLQLIDGATFFAWPYFSDANPETHSEFTSDISAADLAQAWRRAVAIEIAIEPPTTGPLVGLPLHESVASPYELMFVRGVMGNARRLSFSLDLRRGITPVTLYATTSDSVNLTVLANQLPRYLQLVEDFLGPLPSQVLAIGEAGTVGGLEGLNGYWFGTGQVHNHELHLHELIHMWLGIRLGELDLPWFKEGVTTYFGQWLNVQAGWSSAEAWQGYTLLQAADTTGPVVTTSLANTEARRSYYRDLDRDFRDGNDSGWYGLVYGKGPQAALLIDAWILEQTQGQYALVDLVRVLYVKHRPAFTRREMKSEIQILTRANPSPWIDSLFDDVGPIPREKIKAAFAALRLWRDLR
jgi:hypothetical protein